VAFLVPGLESGTSIRLIPVTSPNLIPRPDEVQQHSTDTQGQRVLCRPDRRSESAVVAAVHLMSFRAVFESLQKLPATSDRPMLQTHVGQIPTRERANCGPNGLALHAIQFLPEPFDCSTAAEIIGETSPNTQNPHPPANKWRMLARTPV
jgi:hypothetical protein